jgi:hypothetical protein
MNSVRILAALAVSAAALSPAAAAVVDADAFAAGTNISNSFAGVTLRTVRTGADLNDVTSIENVFSVTDANATTGTRAFGQTSDNSTWGNGAFEYLEAIFDSPVTSVSLDFFANDGNDENPQLLAFDAMGAQIDIDSVGAVPLGSPVTLTVSGTGIKSIRAYWDEINRSANGGLDNLVFNAVPEPATWAMMISGFGFVGAAMRRRATKVAYA